MSAPFLRLASRRVLPSIFSNDSLMHDRREHGAVLHRGRVLRDLILRGPVLDETDLGLLGLADLTDREVRLELEVDAARLEHLLDLRRAGGVGVAGVANGRQSDLLIGSVSPDTSIC